MTSPISLRRPVTGTSSEKVPKTAELLVVTVNGRAAPGSTVHAVEECRGRYRGLSDGDARREVESLIDRVDADVALFRGPPEWRLANARRVLVPIGGGGEHHRLRARLLGAISRGADRDVTFVTVRRPGTSDAEIASTERSIRKFGQASHAGNFDVRVQHGDDSSAALIEAAADHDLIVLGLPTGMWGRREVRGMVLRVANEAPCASITSAVGVRHLARW